MIKKIKEWWNRPGDIDKLRAEIEKINDEYRNSLSERQRAYYFSENPPQIHAEVIRLEQRIYELEQQIFKEGYKNVRN